VAAAGRHSFTLEGGEVPVCVCACVYVCVYGCVACVCMFLILSCLFHLTILLLL
jgi:hypothetical protein